MKESDRCRRLYAAVVRAAYSDIGKVTREVLRKARQKPNGNSEVKRAVDLVVAGEEAIEWFFASDKKNKPSIITVQHCAEALDIDISVLRRHAAKMANENGLLNDGLTPVVINCKTASSNIYEVKGI